MSDISRVMV